MSTGLIIAGTASGVGKTTVACAVVAAFRARGLRVQPFKAGPDYLDPTYLTRAAGRPCRNLDTWMLTPDIVRDLFARAAGDADVAVVEGVMGLFDGRSGEDEAGSTAQLAKLLGLPVVLVVDASKMARSAAAAVLGYQRFDPALQLAGVILNRVGSAAHAEICATAIMQATGLPVLGALARTPAISVPERHLGLIPEVESPLDEAFLTRLAALGASALDIDGLLRHAADCEDFPDASLFPSEAPPRAAAIAVAQDAAFHFYYQDSLDLLTAWGAELVPFSPIADHALPAGIDAVYIGGGFPELFARELAGNVPMLRALRDAATRGVPIYGECGGLMYLGTRLTDLDGVQHEMVGLVPAESLMTGERLTLGYREAASLGTPLLPAGEVVRAHEFHWSTLASPPDETRAAYTVLGDPRRADGFQAGSVTATYLHTHLAARRDLAPNFVATAQRFREREQV